MDSIDDLDLKTFITTALTEVFDTMLSMEVEPFDTDLQELTNGKMFVGSVSFAGKVMGNVRIYLKDTFAHIIAAAMLDMETEEVEEEEVFDVIGELSNMIGGDLKSRLCDSGMTCELSIPSVMSGSDFKIESMGWLRHEYFAFRQQKNTMLVEVFMKISD